MNQSVRNLPDLAEASLRPAFSYIRFSTPEQAKGDSYRRQTAKAEKWAAEHGYRIVEVLADLGISAYRAKNATDGALARFLTWVDEHSLPPGAALIIESFDRFSRAQVTDVLPQFIEVIKAGVTVVTLIDGWIYTRESINRGPSDLINSLVIMARAHEESRTKGDRVAEAWARKQRQATSQKLTRLVPSWLDVIFDAEGKITGFEENKNGEVVRRIFQECIDGYGCRSIAIRLNNEGRWEPFRSERGWQPSTIAKLIRGRAVLGEYHPHTRTDRPSDSERPSMPASAAGKPAEAVVGRQRKKRRPAGKPVLGYYPQIIDEDVWNRANAALRSRRIEQGQAGVERINLLRGLARCVECGARMVIENKSPGKGGRKLVCADAVRSAKCANRRRWKVDFIEEALTLRLDDQRILDVLKRNEGGRRDPIAELDDRIEALKSQLRQYMKISEEQGLQNDDDNPVVEQIRAFSLRLKDAQKRRGSMLAEREAPTPEAARSSLALMRDLAARRAGADGQERLDLRTRIAQALRTLFEEVRFGRTEVHIVVRLKSKPAGSPTLWALEGIETRLNKETGQEQYFLARLFITDAEIGQPMDRATVISDGTRDYLISAD